MQHKGPEAQPEDRAKDLQEDPRGILAACLAGCARPSCPPSHPRDLHTYVVFAGSNDHHGPAIDITVVIHERFASVVLCPHSVQCDLVCPDTPHKTQWHTST
jgi:hypothetical protein